MPAPPVLESPNRLEIIVSAKITQADKATLEQIAAIEQLKVSDILRRAVRFYVEHWRKGNR